MLQFNDAACTRMLRMHDQFDERHSKLLAIPMDTRNTPTVSFIYCTLIYGILGTRMLSRLMRRERCRVTPSGLRDFRVERNDARGGASGRTDRTRHRGSTMGVFNLVKVLLVVALMRSGADDVVDAVSMVSDHMVCWSSTVHAWRNPLAVDIDSVWCRYRFSNVVHSSIPVGHYINVH